MRDNLQVKLRTNGGRQVYSGNLLIAETLTGFASIDIAEAKANAARIVECWNACEGVTGLQPGAVKEMIDFIKTISTGGHHFYLASTTVSDNANAILTKITL